MFLVCTCVWNSLNASSQRTSFYDTRRHHPSWYRREANISLTNFWLLAEGSECSLTAHIVILLNRHLKTQLKLDYRVGSYIIQCDFIFIREEDAEKPLEETQSSACEDRVRGGHLHVKERLLWRAKPSQALISGISLPNSWKTYFCYASFPVSILLGSQSIPIQVLLRVENSRTEYWASFSL